MKLQVITLIIISLYLCFTSCSHNLQETVKNAIQENDIPTLENILVHHKSLTDNYGDTFVSYAIHPKNIEALKILLKAGANPNYSEGKTTLLEWAISCNENDFVELLFDYGADVHFNSRDSYLIKKAINNNNSEILKKLIAQKINLSLSDTNFASFFDMALYNKSYDCAIVLISDNAYRKTLYSEKKLLESIIYSWNETYSPIILNTLFNKEPLDWKNTNALILAINAINYDAVNWLIKNGCNVSEKKYSSYFENYVQPIDYAYEVEHKLTVIETDHNDNQLKEIRKIIQLISRSVDIETER